MDNNQDTKPTMSKGLRIAKIVGIVLLVLGVVASLGFNGYILFNTYRQNLILSGGNQAVTALVANVKQNGSITIVIPTKNGQTESLVLVPKK